jgi:hypothetical protein
MPVKVMLPGLTLLPIDAATGQLTDLLNAHNRVSADLSFLKMIPTPYYRNQVCRKVVKGKKETGRKENSAWTERGRSLGARR